MGHAGSKTRSQGHLVHFKHLASCPDSNAKSFNPIFTKPGQKLYLDDGLLVKYIFLNTFTISQTGVFCDRFPLLFPVSAIETTFPNQLDQTGMKCLWAQDLK